MGGKCAFSTYYDELKSLHSWKCFANTLDIISQMKENSQGYYHQLWRKQTNFKDMYCKMATMPLVFKNWKNCCAFQKWFPDTSLREHSQLSANKQALKMNAI